MNGVVEVVGGYLPIGTRSVCATQIRTGTNKNSTHPHG